MESDVVMFYYYTPCKRVLTCVLLLKTIQREQKKVDIRIIRSSHTRNVHLTMENTTKRWYSV